MTSAPSSRIEREVAVHVVTPREQLHGASGALTSGGASGSSTTEPLRKTAPSLATKLKPSRRGSPCGTKVRLAPLCSSAPTASGVPPARSTPAVASEVRRKVSPHTRTERGRGVAGWYEATRGAAHEARGTVEGAQTGVV